MNREHLAVQVCNALAPNLTPEEHKRAVNALLALVGEPPATEPLWRPDAVAAVLITGNPPTCTTCESVMSDGRCAQGCKGGAAPTVVVESKTSATRLASDPGVQLPRWPESEVSPATARRPRAEEGGVLPRDAAMPLNPAPPQPPTTTGVAADTWRDVFPDAPAPPVDPTSNPAAFARRAAVPTETGRPACAWFCGDPYIGHDGKQNGPDAEHYPRGYGDERRCYCTYACRDAAMPLNPAPPRPPAATGAAAPPDDSCSVWGCSSKRTTGSVFCAACKPGCDGTPIKIPTATSDAQPALRHAGPRRDIVLPTSRRIAHSHLGECDSEHTKACDMLTVEFGELFREIHAKDELLGRWMVWASSVAFKSDEGEALVNATDAVMAGAADLKAETWEAVAHQWSKMWAAEHDTNRELRYELELRRAQNMADADEIRRLGAEVVDAT